MKFIFFVLFNCLAMKAWGLSVDEKLPIRILKVSDTRKTVLINRGLEDGLVIGDHAKFFLSVGVVARGVVVKASPTRSVWSVYRLINAKYVEPDKPMNIKISTPVKLSSDNSKMLAPEDPYNDLTRIKLVQGANDLPEKLDSTDSDELASLKENQKVREEITLESGEVSSFSDQTWEIWSLINLNALSTSSSGAGSDSSGKITNIDFSLGIEKYFSTRGTWYDRISVFPFVHKGTNEVSSGDAVVRTDVLEFGGGVNYHFNAHPTMTGKLLWFAGGMAALGKSEQTFGSANSIDGNSTSFSFGGGIKYFLRWGLGLRAMLDYYIRKESYNFEETIGGESVTSEQSTNVSGPRFNVGLSYRW